MELVIDANIVISALISASGKTRNLIFLKNLSLIAPEYLLAEVRKYGLYIIEKSGISEKDFETAISLIFSRIRLISFLEFELLIAEAKRICPDSGDIEYIVLSLSKNIPLWSDDKDLKKQSLVKVFSTSELIKLLES